MQTVLQNDVTPAQYEGRIVHLETEIERLNAQLAVFQRQQEDICGDMTLIEYDEWNRNQNLRLRNVCVQVLTVLDTARKNFEKLMSTQALTRPLWCVTRAIVNTISLLKRKTEYRHYVPYFDDEDNALFDEALSQARSIAGVQE